jgi:DNA-binding transcriptional LysR family regulator
MSTVGQIEALAARELDLGLVRPPELNLPDAVDLTILRRDPLVMVLPVGHPLAAKQSIAVSDLRGEPLVMYPESAGTGIHPQINRLCREAGFKPTIAMEAGEASTIIGLVAAGCGVSVLPSSFDIIRMREVCYRPMADAEATTALYLAKRKDASSPLVAAFVEVASAEAGAVIAA